MFKITRSFVRLVYRANDFLLLIQVVFNKKSVKTSRRRINVDFATMTHLMIKLKTKDFFFSLQVFLSIIAYNFFRMNLLMMMLQRV